ncbi:hypothetical protein IHE55_27705 [Streptomyces pactum]|uniref:Uncharacterized protein n=1 Tax=Streptomyces pactum TaxID=68249 RepID=A0ABS0NTH4_9ACTN|nr:hypothetical protein [Streptomyces pactum]MBH5338372.1 hypothetical protein [Streptomyces pactum]
MTKNPGGGGGSVVAGRAGGIPEHRLKSMAVSAAHSNAEFFCPDGRATLRESRATTVTGRPAHTVALKVSHRDCGTLHLRLTLASVDDDRSAFLIGLATWAERDVAGREMVDAVLADASLL